MTPLAAELADDVLDRFLRYVRIHTQSAHGVDASPSTEKQLDLSRLLRDELEAIGLEVGQVVRLMDGSNRFRFANDPESLAALESASNTFGPVRAGGQAGSRTGGQPVESGKPADAGKDADHAA